jgi:small-conductance mechanosensitive channel
MERNYVSKTFDAVAETLLGIARRTGLTYNEVNILVYYLLIPLTWTIMLDFILRKPITTPLLLLAWMGIFIATRGRFRQWCDKAFVLSQQFIRFFGEYVKYSVVICVIVPIIIYVILFVLLFA